MAGQLRGTTVAFVTANDGVEQSELTHPWRAVTEAGATARLVAPEAGQVQAFNHLDKGEAFPVDATTAQVRVEDYDALVLPGGVANPDRLRLDTKAVDFVRAFVGSGKPVAVICHGPWTLVEAGVVRGRTLTSWPSLRTDIRNAGGNWVDEELVVDGNIFTSRRPDDLEAFSSHLVDTLARTGARA